jgi:hypothetical protein
MPWLQQEAPRGWKDADSIAERANVLCSALAVVRLALLTSDKIAVAAGTAGASLPLGRYKDLLRQLDCAVTLGLHKLQSDEGQEGLDNGAEHARMGAASGSGQAVDAWLALCRVDDVLQRVLDLV